MNDDSVIQGLRTSRGILAETITICRVRSPGRFTTRLERSMKLTAHLVTKQNAYRWQKRMVTAKNCEIKW